jgi:hypothetical protein
VNFGSERKINVEIAGDGKLPAGLCGDFLADVAAHAVPVERGKENNHRDEKGRKYAAHPLHDAHDFETDANAFGCCNLQLHLSLPLSR